MTKIIDYIENLLAVAFLVVALIVPFKISIGYLAGCMIVASVIMRIFKLR